jgi:hypothetical protein
VVRFHNGQSTAPPLPASAERAGVCVMDSWPRLSIARAAISVHPSAAAKKRSLVALSLISFRRARRGVIQSQGKMGSCHATGLAEAKGRQPRPKADMASSRPKFLQVVFRERGLNCAGMNVPSDMVDVFISYSRADWRHAAEIDSILHAKGLRSFFDRRNLAAGLPWFREGYMPDWLRIRLLGLMPTRLRVQAVALFHVVFERAVRSEDQVFDAVRLRIAQDRRGPRFARPERDEIFLDELAGPVPLKIPRRFRELISATKNEFVRREGTALGVILLYRAVVVAMVLSLSSGPQTTGQWLPFAFLPLIFRYLATGAKHYARPEGSSGAHRASNNR